MLAYDFPLLSLFWAMLAWFMLFAVFFAVIWAFVDNFRRRDHHGWAKAAWAFAIIVLPFLGTMIYIAARPVEADV